MKHLLRIFMALGLIFAVHPLAISQTQYNTSALPSTGSTPEYTQMLTYLATFKESSFSGSETPSLAGFLGFFRGGGAETSTITSRRILGGSDAEPEFEAERLLGTLFRFFSPGFSQTATLSRRESSFVSGDGNGAAFVFGGSHFARGDAEASNPVFEFFQKVTQMSPEGSDPKLQDPRYTLD